MTAHIVDQLKGQRLAVLGASARVLGFAVASLALDQGTEVFPQMNDRSQSSLGC